ncbi:MAG: U32 family peptidase [Papillibacter sp.]|jgi:putative protease|nr:U32 family peptidase [Papillibacter sp.]
MKYELLSPAGDMEKLKTAIYFGADAVYCGGSALHLRAAQTDFTMEGLAEGIAYAHSKGKKIYITVNAFARNDELDMLPEYVKSLKQMGADAIIVSDLGVFAEAREAAPELDIHISTQANITNYKAALKWHELGARRVILARELTLDEIKEIRDKTPPELEIEAFVHGAMCMSYSGRCMMSAVLTGRDSNRGDCAQPCRWNYRLIEEKRPYESYPVYETEEGMTILSSRDLCAIDFIDKLKEAGISSFKIEGRMKSPYYVATVTNAYRKALDGEADTDLLLKELKSASHREFSSGFYFGRIKKEPPSKDGYMQDCIFIAMVLGQREDGLYKLEMRNRFALGETLELLSPNSLDEEFRLEYIEDEDGAQIETVLHPQQLVYIKCPLKLSEGDILRRRENN